MAGRDPRQAAPPETTHMPTKHRRSLASPPYHNARLHSTNRPHLPTSSATTTPTLRPDSLAVGRGGVHRIAQHLVQGVEHDRATHHSDDAGLSTGILDRQRRLPIALTAALGRRSSAHVLAVRHGRVVPAAGCVDLQEGPPVRLLPCGFRQRFRQRSQSRYAALSEIERQIRRVPD